MSGGNLRAAHERLEGAVRCEETWARVAGTVVWRRDGVVEVLSCHWEAEDEG